MKVCYKSMEEKIAFERFLFEDEKEIIIEDIVFCVDRIIMLTKIRPHKLEKAVSLSSNYCKIDDFRLSILEKSNECPVIVYQLYKQGYFRFEEIEPLFYRRETYLLCYYFWKDIPNFVDFIQNKPKPLDYNEPFSNNCFDESFLENTNSIDQLVEFGFISSSIEYCLKYDILDDLVEFNISDYNVKWSPFEWSYKPEYLDLLSFSGYFGSIKCFKHLFMDGFEINSMVRSMVVCSGCYDLYHLCKGEQFLSTESINKASEFCHLSLLNFMLENGADIKASDNWVSIFYF